MSYQIINLRHLHSGGIGDLFLGQRTDTAEYVVLKRLRDHHLACARRSFEREVRILARGLPGLIPLLFCDMRVERPYYVMPYLAGGALTQYAGTFTDEQLQTIATQLATTLANIHSVRDAHGDFKPDNILVTQHGGLKVADPLGNGSIFTMLFSQNAGGTPGYCAPEIRAGGSISRAGDAYSYGATLYHLLTGRRPLDGQRLDPTAEGYVNSPKIREIIAACCQSDPRSRPGMQEVIRMLRGERWADIRAARQQHRELLALACIFGIALLLTAHLTA